MNDHRLPTSTFDGPTALAVGVAFASVIVLDPGGWFPFSIAKWPAVLVVALGAAACLAWAGRPPRAPRWIVAWGLLIAAVVLSAVVGLDDRMAWVGTPVRHLGALSWLVFALLFAVGLHVGSGRSTMHSLLHGLTVAGGLLGGYCLWELVLGAPVGYMGDSSRLGGPYGSAAYLGAACCILLPIAIGIATSTEESRGWRAGAALVAGSLVVATIGSGTRGAIVALALTGTVVGVLSVQTHGRRHRRVVTNTALAASVSACLVLTVVLRDRFSRASPIDSRFDEWQVGLRALADRPLVGFGPEGYRLVVDRYLSAEYVRNYGDAVLPDRAHNGVLDVALSSGVIAAGAYVVILSWVTVAAVRLVRRGRTSQAGAGAAALAFIVQQQFLFPVAEVDAVFWIVAGATVAAAQMSRGDVATAAATPMTPATDGRRSSALRQSLAVVLVAVALGAAVSGVRSVAADRLLRSSTRSAQPEPAIADAARAVDLDPNDIRARVVLARSFERRETLNGVDAAIDAVERAAAISPLDPTVRRERARLASLRAAITGTSVDRVRATAAWRDIVDDAPNCASCQRSLGLVLLDAGDVDGSAAALQRAVLLGDDVAVAVLDATTAD